MAVVVEWITNRGEEVTRMRLRRKKSLIEQAGDYVEQVVESVRPQVESAVSTARDEARHLVADAKEKAGPALADARAKAGPALTDARTRATPYVVDARDRAVVLGQEARDKAAPALSDAKAKAAPLVASGAAYAGAKATDLNERAAARAGELGGKATGKVAELKGEKPKKKGSKLKKLVLVGGLAAVVGVEEFVLVTGAWGVDSGGVGCGDLEFLPCAEEPVPQCEARGLPRESWIVAMSTRIRLLHFVRPVRSPLSEDSKGNRDGSAASPMRRDGCLQKGCESLCPPG